MSKVKLGLATLAHDHAWWTLEQIAAIPEAGLVGVVDRDPDRCRRLAEAHPGCAVFDTIDDLLAAGCDGLVVTAPNNEHRAFAEAAAAAGVACMVQKPMATTYSDALAMAHAAEAAGTVLMVNYFPLWQPAKVAFFDLVRSGVLGDVRQLVFRNGHQGPRGIGVLTLDYQRWLYDPVRHGGGALADQATYGIAYAVWLLGVPQRVHATQTPIAHHDLGVDDLATVLLDYPSAQVRIDGSWAWPHRIESMEYVGAHGSATLDDAVVTRRWATTSINQAVRGEPLPPAARLPAANGVAHFVDVIRSGISVIRPHTVPDNLLIAQVTDAAIRAAATNSCMSID